MFLRTTSLKVSLKLCWRLKSMKMRSRQLASQEITIVKWHFIKSFNFNKQKKQKKSPVKDKLKKSQPSVPPKKNYNKNKC